MKTTIAILSLFLCIDHVCGQNEPAPPVVSTANTQELLKQRLLEYAKEVEGEISSNPTVEMPKAENLSYKRDFLCPKCNSTTTFSGHKALLMEAFKDYKKNVDGLNKIAKEKKLNISFSLDPTNFCSQCFPGKKDRCFHLITYYFDPKTGTVLSQYRTPIQYPDFFALSSFLINKKQYISPDCFDPITNKLRKDKKTTWSPVVEKLSVLQKVLGVQ